MTGKLRLQVPTPCGNSSKTVHAVALGGCVVEVRVVPYGSMRRRAPRWRGRREHGSRPVNPAVRLRGGRPTDWVAPRRRRRRGGHTGRRGSLGGCHDGPLMQGQLAPMKSKVGWMGPLRGEHLGEDSCDFHDASCGNMLETVSLCSPPKGPMGSLWLHECLIPCVVWGDPVGRTREVIRLWQRRDARLWQRGLWRRCA